MSSIKRIVASSKDSKSSEDNILKSKRNELHISEKIPNNWFETKNVKKPTYLKLNYCLETFSSIDITKAINELKRSENSPMFIVALFIFDGYLYNNEVRFFQIKSKLSYRKTAREIFEKMKVVLHGDKTLYKSPKDESLFRKIFKENRKRRYAALNLELGHAYIYVGEKLHENEKYVNEIESIYAFRRRLPGKLNTYVKLKSVNLIFNQC